MSVITKIKSVEPKMVEGHQRSSSGQYGTSFYYYIEFENGWKGEVSSKTAGTYPLGAGTEVEVDIKKEGKGNILPTYTVKKAEGGSAKGGSGWDDPLQTLKIAMGICQECIITTYEIIGRDPEDYKELLEGAQFYFSWVTGEGKIKERSELTRRWYAIRNAVNSMKSFTSDKFIPNKEMNPAPGFSSDNIILMAERWLKQMDDIVS